MHRGLRSTGIGAAAAALALLVPACGSSADATVDRADFDEVMVERFGADDEQAACITRYVFDDYDDAEIALLADEGMTALPQARWEGYLDATVACITHDQPLEGSG
jgi:hypothetical protein